MAAVTAAYSSFTLASSSASRARSASARSGEFFDRQGDRTLHDARPQYVVCDCGKHLGIDGRHIGHESVIADGHAALPMRRAGVEPGHKSTRTRAVGPQMRGEPAAADGAPGEPGEQVAGTPVRPIAA